MEGYVYSYFVNFSLWLFIEEAFFVLPLPRRNRFWLRLGGLLAGYFALGYGCIQLVRLIPSEYHLVSILYYISLFAASLFIIWACFEMDFKETLFVGTAGYAVQHTTYAAVSIIQGTARFFGVQSFLVDMLGDPLWSMPIYAVTGLLCYVTLVRSRKNPGELKKVDLRLVLISLAILCSSVVLSEIIYSWEDQTLAMPLIVSRFYAILSCLLGLLLQFDISQRTQAEQEKAILEQLLSMEQQKQAITRESIDLINMKCHDLKYQLAALAKMESGEERRESIEELQKSVMIYENVLDTGNETLDLVLTEKSLLCQKYHIKLSCIIDGQWLDFMSTADLYSLFGNALDNAIEAVSKEEEEKRIITLMVAKRQQMLTIHMDNQCTEALQFENGLPVTTKNDTQFHGFGTRSIQYIVRRYDGEVKMDWNNDRFDLDILFPLSA